MRGGPTSASASTGAVARISLILWTFGHGLTVLIGGLKGRGYLVQFLVEIPLWALSLAAVAILYLAWRGLEARDVMGRWPLMGLACLAAGAGLSAVDLLYYDWLATLFLPRWHDWAHAFGPRAGNNFALYSWNFCLNATLFWALGVDEKAKQQERITTEAKLAAQEARIEALRFQLNPHFLLNTLNAVASLAAMNRNVEAEAMTMKLADFLHGSLATDAKAPIPLANELAIIESYLDIEAVRFGDRLRVEIDCPNHLLDVGVPSFILQPLVENAVKYAVAPSRSGAMIRIEAREAEGLLLVSVTDTGSDDAARPDGGTGVGLRNIRARLATLYGPGARLDTMAGQTGFTATLRMPLRAVPPLPA